MVRRFLVMLPLVSGALLVVAPVTHADPRDAFYELDVQKYGRGICAMIKQNPTATVFSSTHQALLHEGLQAGQIGGVMPRAIRRYCPQYVPLWNGYVHSLFPSTSGYLREQRHGRTLLAGAALDAEARNQEMEE